MLLGPALGKRSGCHWAGDNQVLNGLSGFHEFFAHQVYALGDLHFHLAIKKGN